MHPCSSNRCSSNPCHYWAAITAQLWPNTLDTGGLYVYDVAYLIVI